MCMCYVVADRFVIIGLISRLKLHIGIHLYTTMKVWSAKFHFHNCIMKTWF